MNRSQRILIAIGLAALAAMAAPYVMRGVIDYQAVSGKTQVYEARSNRPNKDLVLCLIKHPGALNLGVASNDAYTNPVTGLAVQVAERGKSRMVKAWLPEGKVLTAEQTVQLDGCVRGPAQSITKDYPA